MKFECEASSPVTTSPQTASPSLQDEILRDILKEMKTMRTEMKEIRAEVDQIKPDFQIFDSIPHVDKSDYNFFPHVDKSDYNFFSHNFVSYESHITVILVKYNLQHSLCYVLNLFWRKYFKPFLFNR